MQTPQNCDVFVVGGGPAGATAAALLAGRGRRVILADKDHHPRFHIGESLLPHNLPLFDALGVREAIEATSMPKYGIEFVSPFHGKKVGYDFADALDKRFPYAFQVRRSTLDHILLKNAAAKGAEVIEGCRITDIDLSGPNGPVVTAGRRTGGRGNGRPPSSSMLPGAIRCWQARSGSRRRIPGTTAPPSMPISPAPAASKARRKAISASSGSIMAGSGSSPWRTAPPASAPSVHPSFSKTAAPT